MCRRRGFFSKTGLWIMVLGWNGLIMTETLFALNRAPKTYGNVAVGKFYTFSQAPVEAYADSWPCLSFSDGSKLTDEDAGLSWPLDGWVGWLNQPVIEITLDLGKAYDIDTVRLCAASQTEWSIRFPLSMNVQIKTDTAQDWQDFGQTQSPADTTAFSQAWLTVTGDKISARYIRYTLDGHSNNLLVSEIEVLGEVVQTWKNVPDWGCYHGAFPVNTSGHMTVQAFETHAQKALAMVLWYHHMGNSVFGSLSNLSPFLQSPNGGHRYLSIGWLPDLTAAQIAQGQLDDYFQQWFTDSLNPELRNGRSEPIWIRPMNEMNGGWTPYGLDPLNYRRAWRRMYNIAEQIGATKLDIYVWSPNFRSYPNTAQNNMNNYYPGDQYVDWVGVSAYPPSPHIVPTEDERYPREVLREVYMLYSDRKPMMIAEGGFSESCDRIRWINEWFDVLRSEYPAMKAAIWENHNDRRIETTEETRQTYCIRVSDPYFLDNTLAGRADYNQDGRINLDDVTVFAENWLKSSSNLYSYFDACGLLVIEAEQFKQSVPGDGETLGHAWQILIDNPNAIGSGYVQALPNVGLFVTDPIAQQSPRLSYSVQIGWPGTYYLWVRGVGASTNDNTAWYGLNGQVIGSLDAKVRSNPITFPWEKNVGTVTIPKPGLYTLDLWMGDDGLKLDRLLLTVNPDYTASAEPAISQWVSGPVLESDIDGDKITDMADLIRLMELWLQ